MTTIAELVYRAHENACEKGFWDETRKLLNWQAEDDPELTETVRNLAVTQKLALVSTEIAEFEQEAYNRDLAAMQEELADIVIRVFDLCGFLEQPLDEDVLFKRLHQFSTSSSVVGAMYREVAIAVQAHRKGRHDFGFSLQQIVRYAQDFTCAHFWDNHALYRAVIEKMQKNQSRERKHGALY